jgi:hypothetical protein
MRDRNAVLRWLTVGAILLGVTWCAPEPSQAQPTISQDEATRLLLYCVTPAVQYGQYSSYDGGKSAGEILEKKCTKEYLQFHS